MEEKRESSDIVSEHEAINDNDPSQGLLYHDGYIAVEKTSGDKRSRSQPYIFYLIISNLLSILIITGFVLRDIPFNSSLNWELKRVSVPSPLLNRIDLQPKTINAHGKLRDDGSIFRKPPSDAVDQAWSRAALDGYEFINVTKSDIIAAGKDPATAVQWDQSIDSYPAQVEFSHKIHCLNVVRKEIWGDYYFGNVSIASDEAAIKRGDYNPADNKDMITDGDSKQFTLKALRRMHRQHTMHCLHIVLQDLMCNVDVGIISHDWLRWDGAHADKDEAPIFPMADFSTASKCRSYEAASDWVRKNAVQNGTQKWGSLHATPGTQVAQRIDSYWPKFNSVEEGDSSD